MEDATGIYLFATLVNKPINIDQYICMSFSHDPEPISFSIIESNRFGPIERERADQKEEQN